MIMKKLNEIKKTEKKRKKIKNLNKRKNQTKGGGGRN